MVSITFHRFSAVNWWATCLGAPLRQSIPNSCPLMSSRQRHNVRPEIPIRSATTVSGKPALVAALRKSIDLLRFSITSKFSRFVPRGDRAFLRAAASRKRSATSALLLRPPADLATPRKRQVPFPFSRIHTSSADFDGTIAVFDAVTPSDRPCSVLCSIGIVCHLAPAGKLLGEKAPFAAISTQIGAAQTRSLDHGGQLVGSAP